MKTSITALASNIDNEIVELSYQVAKVESLILLNRKAYKAEADKERKGELFGDYCALRDKKDPLSNSIATLSNVYRMYNWNRAYLVPGGHVHKTRSCSSCFVTTRFVLLPECSGMKESEIVNLAGERACTICYPSAPVDVLKRPTMLMTDDERAELKAKDARRTEREAKAAEAASARIEVMYPGETRLTTFKTTRSALNEVASNYWWHLFSLRQNNVNREANAARHLGKFEALLTVIAPKVETPIEVLRETIIAKTIKKTAAEQRQMAREEAKRLAALAAL